MEENKYLVFTRKWRPQLFDDIIGQEQVTAPLRRALELKRIMHAYLLSGPRGVGKTTTARVLAKALNCEKNSDFNPCNECASCKEITEGGSLDVTEIDGASNNGVEQVRELRERVNLAAARGRYKIYIIDEVHMLSTAAFNALLKTLEEPPKHVIFIFATTDPQKIPQTILSRCQHFRFRRMPVNLTVENLKKIAANERINADEEAFFAVARASDGALRDAQRLFDQAYTYAGGKKITSALVNEMLGTIDASIIQRAAAAVINKDVKEGLKITEDIFEAGYDLRFFMNGLIMMLRDTLVIKSTGGAPSAGSSKEEADFLLSLAQAADKKELLWILKSAMDTEMLLPRTHAPNIAVEAFMMNVTLNTASDERGGVKVKPAAPRKEEAAAAEKNEPPPEEIQTEEEEPKHPGIMIESIEEEEEIKVLTKQIIENRWDNVIERAKAAAEYADIEAALESAGVISYDEPNLAIIGSNPFLTDTLKTNVMLLKKLLSEEFKRDVFVFVYSKEEYKLHNTVKRDTQEEELRNMPVVKELSKFFEIKDIKSKKAK